MCLRILEGVSSISDLSICISFTFIAPNKECSKSSFFRSKLNL